MSSVIAEMWVWYALTLIVVTARMLSRRLLYGSFRGLLLDDYLMMCTQLTYTVLLAVVHVLTSTPTNLINPADHVKLTPESIKQREFGSKLVLVTEHMQMLTIWGVKACLLLMYSRLTMSLRQNLLVKITAGYVAFSFVLMQVLWFAAWCRPFNHYWQVPPDNLNCSAETNHMITNAVFNLSTDLLIFSLPMPVFLQSQLPLKRKIVLCLVFALGAFTILAAILSKIYSLGDPYGNSWIYWYIREVSTAIITANLPLTWTLLQRIFRLGSFSARYGNSSNPHTGDQSTRFRSAYGNLSSRTGGGGVETRKSRRGGGNIHDPDLSPSESQEQIAGSNNVPLRIYRKDEVVVTREDTVVKDRRESPSSEGPDGISERTFGVGDSPTGSINGDRSNGEGEMGVVSRAFGGV